MSEEERELLRNLDGNLEFLSKQIQAFEQPAPNPHGEATQFRRQFWCYYSGRYPEDGVPPGYGGNAFRTQVVARQLYVSMSVAQEAAYVWIKGQRGESLQEILPRILPYQDALRRECQVKIEANPNYAALSTHAIDTHDTENWRDIAQWLHETVAAHRALEVI